MKSELTGNFEKVVVGLMMPGPVYDAYELRNAIKVSEDSQGKMLRKLSVTKTIILCFISKKKGSFSLFRKMFLGKIIMQTVLHGYMGFGHVPWYCLKYIGVLNM